MWEGLATEDCLAKPPEVLRRKGSSQADPYYLQARSPAKNRVGSEGSPSCTTHGGSGAVPRDEAHHGACRPTRSRGGVSAAGLRAASDEKPCRHRPPKHWILGASCLTGTCSSVLKFLSPPSNIYPLAHLPALNRTKQAPDTWPNPSEHQIKGKRGGREGRTWANTVPLILAQFGQFPVTHSALRNGY